MEEIKIKNLCEKCGGVIDGDTFCTATGERPCTCRKVEHEIVEIITIPGGASVVAEYHEPRM